MLCKPLWQAGIVREPDGLDELRRKAPLGADPVRASRGVGEEQRATARADHFLHGVQKQLEHPRQVEPHREGLGEVLERLLEDGRRHVEAGRPLVARVLGARRHLRAEGHQLVKESMSVLGLAQHRR